MNQNQVLPSPKESFKWDSLWIMEFLNYLFLFESIL